MKRLSPQISQKSPIIMITFLQIWAHLPGVSGFVVLLHMQWYCTPSLSKGTGNIPRTRCLISNPSGKPISLKEQLQRFKGTQHRGYNLECMQNMCFPLQSSVNLQDVNIKMILTDIFYEGIKSRLYNFDCNVFEVEKTNGSL